MTSMSSIPGSHGYEPLTTGTPSLVVDYTNPIDQKEVTMKIIPTLRQQAGAQSPSVGAGRSTRCTHNLIGRVVDF